mmetsp:Transcript_9828/g.18504  ORF Transcript_9828/g.18504 Transcript_9828/m.18504 type:complete len:377 (+) Transcript_9828:477-1607(+)
MDATCADSNLCAKSKPEAVGESRAGVVEDAGAVHAQEELLGERVVLRDDALGVAGAVRVDVGDRLVQPLHQLHRQRQAAVLQFCRRAHGQAEKRGGAHPAEHLHARVLEGLQDGGEAPVLVQLRVHQQRLQGVTSGWVVDFGVHHQLDGFAHVAVVVHVHVAHPVRVAHDGDLGVVLDVGHEGVAAPRDHEVDDVVQLEQIVYALARRHQPDERRVHLRGQSLGDDAVQRYVGAHRLLPALEQQAVPGANGEAGNLRQRVGPGFENDQEHAQRGAHLLELQALRNLCVTQALPQRLLHLRQEPHSLGQLLQSSIFQLQAVQQCGVRTVFLRLHKICRVLTQNLGLVCQQSICNADQRGGPRLGRKGLQASRGGARS